MHRRATRPRAERRPHPVRYALVMPAAGAGRRFGSSAPKQHASLAGRSVLEWALVPFLDDPRCTALRLVLAAGDPQAPRLAPLLGARGRIVQGGEERCDSVLAGLASLEGEVGDEQWVLVHDAARPLLARADLERLLATVDAGETGGLLAAPLADTLKVADADGRCAGTVPRAGLWCAQTPQMFRRGALRRALESARATGRVPTDEAQAMEWTGVGARLVAAQYCNLKVTTPADLAVAAAVLAARAGEHGGAA